MTSSTPCSRFEMRPGSSKVVEGHLGGAEGCILPANRKSATGANALTLLVSAAGRSEEAAISLARLVADPVGFEVPLDAFTRSVSWGCAVDERVGEWHRGEHERPPAGCRAARACPGAVRRSTRRRAAADRRRRRNRRTPASGSA
jgi:hypothetical protein